MKRTFCKDCEHAKPTNNRTMIWCNKFQENFSREFHWCDEPDQSEKGQPAQTNLPIPGLDLDVST